ncbi:hypothetical protein MOQ72_43745 [Saccharopolyspora sp. K220]|uniref:glycosyltransferase family 2 protein n=1 Tax=Saccharopolyspora soli TaxID=2926618 RepID=UPI001F57159B|nr:glycosyltransferase family 2 protein [Saccharopolyspora soli]MCI2424326.1 hypothetical protein [Saccharopolyspora soli]
MQVPYDFRDWRGRRWMRACFWSYFEGFPTISTTRNERRSVWPLGTMCLFRRAALIEAGGWSETSLTEDWDMGGRQQHEVSLRTSPHGFRPAYQNVAVLGGQLGEASISDHDRTSPSFLLHETGGNDTIHGFETEPWRPIQAEFPRDKIERGRSHAPNAVQVLQYCDHGGTNPPAGAHDLPSLFGAHLEWRQLWGVGAAANAVRAAICPMWTAKARTAGSWLDEQPHGYSL